MATKTENADIRELQTRMRTVTDDIGEMKQDIKTILANQDSAYNQLKEQKADKSELAEMETKTKNDLRIFKWVTIPLTVLATAVITILVQDYFQQRQPIQPQTIEVTNER